MIASIVKCPNNMVMVFNEKGEQIPEHQGDYLEVKERILKEAPLSAAFSYLSDYKPEFQAVPRDEW